eukprot:1170482-Rhodomonas_salina.1
MLAQYRRSDGHSVQCSHVWVCRGYVHSVQRCYVRGIVDTYTVFSDLVWGDRGYIHGVQCPRPPCGTALPPATPLCGARDSRLSH